MICVEASYSVFGKFKDKTTGLDVDIPSVLAFNATIGLDF